MKFLCFRKPDIYAIFTNNCLIDELFFSTNTNTFLDGNEITLDSLKKKVKNGIVLMYKEPYLFQASRLKDNIKIIKEETEKLYTLSKPPQFLLVNNILNKRRLSLFERFKLSLYFVFMFKPRYILSYDYFSNLTYKEKIEAKKILIKIVQRKVSFIFNTRYIETVKFFSTNVKIW